MKRIFSLISLLVLALGSSYVVSADDDLRLDSNPLSEQDNASSMTWPMLPGESVNGLARMFYPNNRTMQQQFVTKTLRLNADTQSNLKVTARFDAPTLLVIPTLKSLSKNAVKSNKKSNKQSLKMSYGLRQAIEQVPQKLMQDYEELVNKNAFLKEQLSKLNEKIELLQSKLDALKLILDKTLTLSDAGLSKIEQPVTNQAVINLSDITSTPALVGEPVVTAPTPEAAVNQPPARKVFKNLNKEIKPTPVSESAAGAGAGAGAVPSLETSFFDRLNIDLVKAALVVVALVLLGTFTLKKYRERMFDNLSFATSKTQNTVTDFSAYFEGKSVVKEEENLEIVQQVKAAKEVEERLNATLEEAKLLLSVNRATDAIAHLKATIASQPKASISHWLYLLEVFRKLNMKDEFEQYADGLHQTFNVMTPVWYDQSAAIYVPQSLEEFPHILEQLFGVWPGELASVYLRSLITDNRGGDRVGFGKDVLDEILMLIELLDTHKQLPS